MKTSQLRTLPAILLSVVALTAASIVASPAARAADEPAHSAFVDSIHCSDDEGFFIVSYSTTSAEPVSFVTRIDGEAPKDPIEVTSDEPIGDSFGTTPGSHLVEVFADGVEIHEETIEVECSDVILGPPPVVVDDSGLGEVLEDGGVDVEEGHTGLSTLPNTGA